MEERLQKLMSQAGIASRRASEALIEQGRVTVNGERASVGDKADPAKDDIRVDGVRLRISTERIYVMVNKPSNVVTAVLAQSQEERRTVRDLVPLDDFLYPVGRLDADSEGLILLTNDGDLAEKLTHPRYAHPKVYEVAVYGNISDTVLDTWRRGITLEDGPTKPVKIQVLSREKELSWLRITMQEGRKRQIRRVARLLHHPVNKLIRTEFATLTLKDVTVGQWRYLTPEEIAALRKSVEDVPSAKKTDRRRSSSSSRSHADAGTDRTPITSSSDRRSSGIRTSRGSAGPSNRSTSRPSTGGRTSADRVRREASYTTDHNAVPTGESGADTSSGSAGAPRRPRPSRPSTSSSRTSRSRSPSSRSGRSAGRPNTGSRSRTGSTSKRPGSSGKPRPNGSSSRNSTRSRSNKRNDDR